VTPDWTKVIEYMLTKVNALTRRFIERWQKAHIAAKEKELKDELRITQENSTLHTKISDYMNSLVPILKSFSELDNTLADSIAELEKLN
jgi:uncharacterized protein YlxW (UPF0749 family)